MDAGTESTETAERAAELEEVDRARARWYAETAVTRDKAHRSGAELRARGIDLDASDDRVTADEWIEAHRAEQAEHERNQEITADYEVADHDDQEIAEQNDEIAEPPVTDVRDSAPRRDERADAIGPAGYRPSTRPRPTPPRLSWRCRRSRLGVSRNAARQARRSAPRRSRPGAPTIDAGRPGCPRTSPRPARRRSGSCRR